MRIDGHDVSALRDARLAAVRGRRIGFVFQQFHLVEGLSALENVADGLLYAGVPRRRRLERAREALAAVGLSERAGHRPARCPAASASASPSPGRWSVIRRSCSPTSRPGTSTAARARPSSALLAELHTRGRTIVLITHDREIAARAPRRVALLDGRVVDDGTA